MGDRGNVFVAMHPHHGKEPEGGIYIYSHWGGHALPDALQTALKVGDDRWDDEAYLTRIIIDRVIGEKNWGETTGVGVTTYLTDNEYPVLVVNPAKKTVGVAEVPSNPLKGVRNETSFERFIKLDAEALEKFRGDDE